MSLFFGHWIQLKQITFEYFIISYYFADLMVLSYELKLFRKWQYRTSKRRVVDVIADGFDAESWMFVFKFFVTSSHFSHKGNVSKDVPNRCSKNRETNALLGQRSTLRFGAGNHH